MVGPPPHDRRVVAAVALVALATLAYSLLILGQILLWFATASTLAFFYLCWRAVRALERIADAKTAEARIGAQ